MTERHLPVSATIAFSSIPASLYAHDPSGQTLLMGLAVVHVSAAALAGLACSLAQFIYYRHRYCLRMFITTMLLELLAPVLVMAVVVKYSPESILSHMGDSGLMLLYCVTLIWAGFASFFAARKFTKKSL